MDITIIGAGGAIGREIAQSIISEQLLRHDQTLTLVGNPEGQSGRSLYGFAVDLMDAYAEIVPKVKIVFSPDEIRGDLIVMAGGSTLNSENSISRDSVSHINFPIFQTYAQAIYQNGHGHEIVICISNPNELAVATFAHYLGRKRVIGMGAFLDSLRFRQEIAHDLGIRRQRIHGFMVGEHGVNMVPLWSSVHIYGFSELELNDAIHQIRKGYQTSEFPEIVRTIIDELKDMVFKGYVKEAYEKISQYPPDIRVAVKPFVTHFSGSKTVMGTARSAMDLIRTITMGNDSLISG